jgi:hypothetical protein
MGKNCLKEAIVPSGNRIYAPGTKVIYTAGESFGEVKENPAEAIANIPCSTNPDPPAILL